VPVADAEGVGHDAAAGARADEIVLHLRSVRAALRAEVFLEGGGVEERVGGDERLCRC
jgi:hypothetical protein